MELLADRDPEEARPEEPHEDNLMVERMRAVIVAVP